MQISSGQLLLVVLGAVSFALAGVFALLRATLKHEGMRFWSRIAILDGVLLSLAALIWHSISRGQWMPINDNFDALLWLAVLLALFVLYVQSARPIPMLEGFMLPVVLLLTVAAALFGRLSPHAYQTIGKDTWLWVHSATAYGGAAIFAIAAAGGAMYVLASRVLRRKSKGPPPRLASLERLEHLMMSSVTLGFALLTISAVTGFVRMIEEHRTAGRSATTKVLLATLAWVVYALVMHAPINPRFRGRRAAILSIFGFVLIAGTLVAAQFMPGGNR